MQGVHGEVGEAVAADVAHDVEPRLLEVVDEVDEGEAGLGRVDEEEHLGPPVLHVVLPGVQQQQVLPHLDGGVRSGSVGQGE